MRHLPPLTSPALRAWCVLLALVLLLGAAVASASPERVRVLVRVESPVSDPGGALSRAAALERTWSLYDVRVRPVLPSMAALTRRGPLGPAALRALTTLSQWYTAELEVGALPRWWAEVVSDPGIEGPVVEPLQEVAATIPNDPSLSGQRWFLDLIGAPIAWDTVRGGDGEVVVAIVDTGTDIGHPDLAANVWRNPGEIEGNGVDDDDNGFVDDVYGWNFANETADPRGLADQPFNRDHGTHVAGIVGARTNNGIGVAGVGFDPRIMAVNVADPTQDRFVRRGYDGILYAAMMGADVINCSWRSIRSLPGGGGIVSASYLDFENAVCETATALGSLVVAAAGNDGTRTAAATPAFYPSVLTVTATRFQSERLWSVANVGPWVDLAAPGEFVLSTLSTAGAATNPYGALSGTSMATPMVSAAAALLRTQHPQWSPLQLRQRLRGTARSLVQADPDRGALAGAGMVQLDRAVSTALVPGLAIDSLALVDGDGDGLVEGGETITLEFDITSPFGYDGPVDILFSTTDEYARPLEDRLRLPRLPAGATLRVERGLTFYVRESTPSVHIAQIDLRWTAAGVSEVSTHWVELVPLHGTVRGGGVEFSAAANGKLGYADPTRALLPSGRGLRTEGARTSSMSFGSLVLATGPMRISDAVQSARPASALEDFRPEQDGSLRLDLGDPATGGRERLVLRYNDNANNDRLGVGIEQTLTGWSDGTRGSFVLSHWRVRARIEALTGMYLGTLVDWTARASGGSERVTTDPVLRAQWVQPADGSDAPWAGAIVLEGPGQVHGDWLWSVAPEDSSLSAQRPAVFDAEILDRPLADEALWQLLTRPVVAQASADGNVAGVLAMGPVDLERGAAVDLVMAFAVAEDRSSLLRAFDDARVSWQSVREGRDGLPPTRVELLSNVPNPFNPSTDIRFALPNDARVRLEIFDLRGRRVRTLLDGPVGAGFHRRRWNGDDDRGRAVASGVYLASLRTERGEALSRRLVLIR